MPESYILLSIYSTYKKNHIYTLLKLMIHLHFKCSFELRYDNDNSIPSQKKTIFRVLFMYSDTILNDGGIQEWFLTPLRPVY